MQGTKFKIDFMLGGDWKFLACVCGLDSASSKYSCIWCICSKDERHIDKKLSITDKEEGAQTVEDIRWQQSYQKIIQEIQLLSYTIV